MMDGARAIAAFTVGMAGADLAALCNEASFEAARAGNDALSIPHFRRALSARPAADQRDIAGDASGGSLQARE